MDTEIISRCDKVLRMLEEEPQEISLGIKGDILEQYKGLLNKESECMRRVREQVRNLPD